MRRSVSITGVGLSVLQAKKNEEIIQWRLVGVVSMLLFCDVFMLTLVIPIFPQLFRDNFSSIEIGVLFAAKPFFQFFMNPVIGAQVDRVGPVYPLMFGTSLLACAAVVMTVGVLLQDMQGVSYALVLIARSIQGVSSASTMSSSMSLMATRHSEAVKGTAMGLVMTGLALGSLLGPPLGGVMGFYINLWSPFLVVCCILAVNIVLQFFYVFLPHHNEVSKFRESMTDQTLLVSLLNEDLRIQETEGEEEGQGGPSTLASIWSLLQRSDIIAVVCSAIMSNSTIGVIEPLVPRWLGDEFDQSILWQGIIFGFATLAYLIATPLAGVLSDRVPIWWCMVFGFASMGTGLMLFSVAHTVSFAAICLFLIGTGMGFIDIPILPLLADIVKSLHPQQPLSSSENLKKQEGLLSLDGVESAAETAGEGKGEAQLLGVTYALNDMCFSIGFFLGPLVGTGIETAFGEGEKGFRRAMISVGVLCFSLIPLILCNLGLRKSTTT